MNRKPDRYEKHGNRVLDILSAVFFIVITAFYPLYLTGVRYDAITKNKTSFFITVTGITVFAAIIMLFIFTSRARVKDYFIKNEPVRKISIHEWALLAFLLFTFISSLASPYQDIVWNGYTLNGVMGRWEGFWAFLCYGLTFFIISRLHRPKRLHFLIFAGSAVLVSLYGILQFLGFDILEALGFFSPIITGSLGRISYHFRTTLGNVNIVSAYCSLVTVLFAVLFAGERSKWGALYLVSSLASFAMLLIADSDAGKVGVLVTMVLLIPYWLSDRERLGKICVALSGWCAVYAGYQGYLSMMKRNIHLFDGNDRAYLNALSPSNPALFAALSVILLAVGLCLLLLLKKWPERRFKIAGIAFLTLSIVGSLLFVEIMGAKWADRPDNIVWQAREVMHGRLEDSFGTNRGWVWKHGLSVIPKNPLLGTGPDTFYHAMGDEMQQEAFRVTGTVFDKAHNSFIQIAVCMGIPALLAYLAFLGSLFFPFLKKAFNRPVLLAFGAAALSYLIQSFFQVDTPIDRPLLWIVLGVMAGELWRERIGA